jgi:hypothetical protein
VQNNATSLFHKEEKLEILLLFYPQAPNRRRITTTL